MNRKDPRKRGDPGGASFEVEFYPFYLINRIVGRYNPLIETALKPIGVDVPTWRVLMILGERAPRTIKEISETTVINLSTLTRIIQRMERADLIACRLAADDQRVTLVSLTPLGERKLAASRTAVAPLYAQAIANFSRDDFEQLASLLNQLFDNLSGDQKIRRAGPP